MDLGCFLQCMLFAKFLFFLCYALDMSDKKESVEKTWKFQKSHAINSQPLIKATTQHWTSWLKFQMIKAPQSHPDTCRVFDPTGRALETQRLFVNLTELTQQIFFCWLLGHETSWWSLKGLLRSETLKTALYHVGCVACVGNMYLILFRPTVSAWQCDDE